MVRLIDLAILGAVMNRLLVAHQDRVYEYDFPELEGSSALINATKGRSASYVQELA